MWDGGNIYVNGFIVNTRVSQKFCNILVTRSTIQQLWMLFLRTRKWQTPLNYMPSSPDILQELLIGFTSIVWSMDVESIVLSLPDIAWSSKDLATWSKFLEPYSYCTMMKYAFTFNNKCFCFLLWCYGSVQTCKACSQIRLHCMLSCVLAWTSNC